MTLTVAPSTEACQAIVDRINSGGDYTLDVEAEYSRVEIQPLEDVERLRVDVVHDEEEQLDETFDSEDRTSHRITIWIRDKLGENTSAEQEHIDDFCLLVRQIFQRINNFISTDRRVKVWEVDEESKMTPDKEALRTLRTLEAMVILRVEVEAS